MKRLLCVLMMLPVLVYSQQTNVVNTPHALGSVQWSEAGSWEEIKYMARTQNKFIFVDVYATWCGPCKMMDKNVYSNDTIVQILNADFISIKVQMDVTPNDNEKVKSWYKFANVINEQYKPDGYPTYLFFSPDGKLVQKELGYKSPALFASIVKEALKDPIGQYENDITRFKEGKLEYAQMPALAALAKRKDKELAKNIAITYKEKWLALQPDEIAFSKDNMLFISNFYQSLIHSGDRYFNFFKANSRYADSLIKSPIQFSISANIVRGIIIKEEITDKIYSNGKAITHPKPDWAGIYLTITQKYGKTFAETLFPDQQINFYFIAANWKNYIKYVNIKIKKYPPTVGGKLFGPQFGDAFGLNIYAWNMFLTCDDKKALAKAVKWSDMALLLETQKLAKANYNDTKANILYRIGKVKEAIQLEEEVVKIGGNAFSPNLDKMKQGLPTWIVK